MVGISIGNFPCVDPKKIAEYCVSQGLSTSWYGKPNKYIRPIGAEPGYGHLLLQKSDYDALVRTGTTVYTLRMQSSYSSGIFPGIMLAGFPRNLTPGAKDPVLMTEITDTTSNLLKATNTRYTWRDKPSSTTPVNPKTWLTAAQDLWEKCQFAAPFPGLPANVHGGTLDLEQFDCHGFRAISCLEDLLQALGCVLAYDPTQNTISIQYVAADQERIIEFATFYRDLLVHDETPYNPTPLFNVPTQVRVLFPVWSEYTGEDPRVMYAKDVSLDLSSGLTGATANGTVILQDKQPLRVDSTGAALNATLIDNRAAAIAATYLDRIRTTTCQWPINRVYKGFIAGQQTPGLPGVMFDLVAWFDTGEGPMTAFLRQGIAGTGELYDTDSLPTAGIISTDHDPNMIVDGLGVVRANGIQPSLARAKQNEGWWDDPTREVVRLVGTGLGPYMMRTQSLRYGEYAQVSTGGRGDLRGRLWRPWDDNSTTSQDGTRFCWVLGGYEPGDHTLYAAYLMKQDDKDATGWSVERTVYLGGANSEPLVTGLKYMAHESQVQYAGSVGTLDVYHTFCCNGTPVLPPRFVSGCVSGGCYFPSTLYLELTPLPAPNALPGSPIGWSGTCSGYSGSLITIPLSLQASPTEASPIISNTLNWMCDTPSPQQIDVLYQSASTTLPDGQIVTMYFARPYGSCYFMLGSDRKAFLGTVMYCAFNQYGYAPISDSLNPPFTYAYTGCPSEAIYIGEAYALYEIIVGDPGSPSRCQFLARVRQ